MQQNLYETNSGERSKNIFKKHISLWIFHVAITSK